MLLCFFRFSSFCRRLCEKSDLPRNRIRCISRRGTAHFLFFRGLVSSLSFLLPIFLVRLTDIRHVEHSTFPSALCKNICRCTPSPSFTSASAPTIVTRRPRRPLGIRKVRGRATSRPCRHQNHAPEERPHVDGDHWRRHPDLDVPQRRQRKQRAERERRAAQVGVAGAYRHDVQSHDEDAQGEQPSMHSFCNKQTRFVLGVCVEGGRS